MDALQLGDRSRLVVFLTTQARMSTRTWIIAVAAAVVLGGAVASDQLVLVGAIGPLLLAAAGVAIRHPTREGRMVGLVAGLVAVGAVAIAAGVMQIMEASGFVTTTRVEGWKDASVFLSQTAVFLEEALRMFNGHFFGRQLTTESALTFATAIGVIVALVAPFILLRRRMLRSAAGRYACGAWPVGVHLLLGRDDGHRPARGNRE